MLVSNSSNRGGGLGLVPLRMPGVTLHLRYLPKCQLVILSKQLSLPTTTSLFFSSCLVLSFQHTYIPHDPRSSIHSTAGSLEPASRPITVTLLPERHRPHRPAIRHTIPRYTIIRYHTSHKSQFLTGSSSRL